MIYVKKNLFQKKKYNFHNTVISGGTVVPPAKSGTGGPPFLERFRLIFGASPFWAWVRTGCVTLNWIGPPQGDAEYEI